MIVEKYREYTSLRCTWNTFGSLILFQSLWWYHVSVNYKMTAISV